MLINKDRLKTLQKINSASKSPQSLSQQDFVQKLSKLPQNIFTPFYQMSYDEVQLLKARVNRLKRVGQDLKALKAIAEFSRQDLTEDVQKQLVPLLNGWKADSQDQMLVLKFILQQMSESNKLDACKAMAENCDNMYIISWLCECDINGQYLQEAWKSPFIIQNYIESYPIQYFIVCLGAHALWQCKKILETFQSDVCDLLLQAAIRRNGNAFKLIRNRYKQELDGMDQLLEAVDREYFAQQSQTGSPAADDLD